MLAEILVAVLQLIAEILLQIFAETLAEFGIEAVREAIKPSAPRRPLLAAIGYVLLGGMFAAVSLWPFPHSFVHHAWLRLANLLIAPTLAGLSVVAIGRWRMRRGQQPLYLHKFGYAFLFAFVFALVRYIVIR